MTLSSQNLVPFCFMKWSKFLLHTSRELKFFPLRGFGGKQNKCEVMCVRIMQLNIQPISARSRNRRPDRRQHPSDCTISDAFNCLLNLISAIWNSKCINSKSYFTEGIRKI